MGNRDRFNRKGTLDSLAAPATKKKVMAPTSGLEDVYFTWGTMSDAVRYAEVVNKLKEYVVVDFQDQAVVAARAMEELKAPTFVKSDRPIRVYWADKKQTRETNNKHNAGATKDNVPTFEDWEHKLEVEEYLQKYKCYKEETKAWAENKAKCNYLII